MTTTAAVRRGPQSPFTVEDLTIDAPRADEILVRIKAVGVCHTDLALKSALPEGLPAVLGHEGAGIVEAVGDSVTDLAVGDHVAVSFASCGACPRCAAGEPAYCRNFPQLNTGGHRSDGSSVLSQDGAPVFSSFFGQSSFADHVITAARNAVVVPADLDLTVAAPMGCGFQTGAGAVANVLAPSPSDPVVVFGGGGVGLAAVMAARALGVETIVCVELDAGRRELASSVGATHVLDGGAEDIVDQIREVTGGGAVGAVDTTAVPAVIANAALALAPRGTLVVLGIGRPEITLDVSDLINNGKSVRGSIEGDADPRQFVPQLINWYRDGRFPVDKIITTFPFTQINEAVAATADGVIKPVLTF